MYQEVITIIEGHLQSLLEERKYDTVGNFLEFYSSYKNSQCENLSEFFSSFNPPITSKHHTCVGLAIELWHRLTSTIICPDLSKNLFLVSCEENLDCPEDYANFGQQLHKYAYTLEKEHVLLALKINLKGRKGMLLCDPGYHIGRVVTVMEDGKFPQTGWFVQSNESNVLKEYNYKYSTVEKSFIEWQEKSTRDGIVQSTSIALIYVAKPYATSVDVTERRNLVYNFRSLLQRDAKGHLTAGMYFKVKENMDEFTIFFHENETKKRIKLNFANFTNTQKINPSMMDLIDKCNTQMKMNEQELLGIIVDIANALVDKSFIIQLLEINTAISVITEDN